MQTKPREKTAREPVRDRDGFERAPSPESHLELHEPHYELGPAPIPADWILEGTPSTRSVQLAGSTDGMGSTYMWDCTAGRFNWFYDLDETIWILEGSVLICDAATGKRHLLRAGDVFFFRSGSQFEWTVESYIRKIAFLHIPLSRKARLLLKIYRAMHGLIPGRRVSEMSGSNGGLGSAN